MSGRQTLGTKLLPGIGRFLSDATHTQRTEIAFTHPYTHTHTYLSQETTLEKQHKPFYRQKLEKKAHSSGTAPAWGRELTSWQRRSS